MPGEHSSYWVGLTPLPRFRAEQDGRLPRTYLRVRGTTSIHAAATSSGLPRTPLRALRVGVQGPPLRGERGTSSAGLGAGCFLLKSPPEAGSTVECRVLRCSSAGRFRELEALPCTLVQTYHEILRVANRDRVSVSIRSVISSCWR